MKLFRDEVREARSVQWLGPVRLRRPVSFSLITGVSLAIALALLVFVTWGSINRKVKLSGLLMPAHGSLNIAAPQAGILMEIPVSEGQTVKAGDVLMVLNTAHQSLRNGSVADTGDRVALQIETRRQTLLTERALREFQSRQREQTLADRIRTLQTELRRAEDERSLYERRVQLAEVTLARNEKMANEGFLAMASVQTKQEELIDAKARLHSVERTRLGLEHDLQALRGESSDLSAQLKTDLNQVKRAEASLEQEAEENLARKGAVITAPYSGKVSALGLHRGQSVQAGQALVTLLPSDQTGQPGSNQEARVEAQLFAPSFTVGFLRPGQVVYVRYAAYPYQKFGLYSGRISQVSASPFSPSELPPNLAQQLMAQAGSSEALYRVNVELDHQAIHAFGETLPLKPGLTLDADVMQESRKIWEWVLEPILAAHQRARLLLTPVTAPKSPAASI